MTAEEQKPLPYDPAEVTDLGELAACMRRLVERRGLSYSALGKAAEGLPRRNGQGQSLPRSTVSDMLSGKRVPPKDKLLTLLAVCRVSPDDVPAWLAAWDRARSNGTTASTTPPPAQPAHRWRPLVVPVATAAVTSAAITAGAFWSLGTVSPTTAAASTGSPPSAAVVVIQNKYTDGPTEMIDYTTPAYLSTQTRSLCQTHGCKIAGTDMESGALLPVTCHTSGEKMWNYNLDTAVLNKNPNQSASTLWYRGVFPDGRSGYINETRVVAASRGGLGLPECAPN